MKNTMKEASIPNEISIESGKDWLWKVQWNSLKYWWKSNEQLMKYLLKVVRISYEKRNENSLKN